MANIPDQFSTTPTPFILPNGCRRVVEILDVHDGDTFRCRVLADEDLHRTWTVRIRAVNAPELNEPGGPEARNFLSELLTTTTNIYVAPYLTARSFNRRVMDVWVDVAPAGDPLLVADLIIEAKHGKRALGLGDLT